MNPFNMKYLELSGTPRQIGQAHGEALRQEINEFIAEGVEGMKAAGITPEAYLNLLFEKSQFFQAAQRWVPDIIDEIHGIADGANLDFRSIFAWQLVDERDWFFSRAQSDLLKSPPDHCSALGAFGSVANPTIIAQNADMGRYVDGKGVLIRKKYTHNGFEHLVVTLPGLFSVYGMNDHGVGVCLNALGFWMNKSSNGLATIFLAGGILEQPTLRDAENFIGSAPHATGENYLIGGREGAVSYEGSSNRVARYIPYEGAQVVYHTNHALVNDDIEITPEVISTFAPERQERARFAVENTTERLRVLESHLRDRKEPLTVEGAKAILSTHESAVHPVCRHKREDTEAMTTFCFIMELGEQPAMHIASGPPCMNEFRTFTLG
jgi:isopenicillin-N N-acyltransferase like protein